MTPSLCETGRLCARHVAGLLQPPTPATTFDSMETRLSSYSQSIRWLRQHGCDCREEIAVFEETVRLYPESYPGKWFLDSLAEMRKEPGEDAK
jgi:hypothetical protein